MDTVAPGQWPFEESVLLRIEVDEHAPVAPGLEEMPQGTNDRGLLVLVPLVRHRNVVVPGRRNILELARYYPEG